MESKVKWSDLKCDDKMSKSAGKGKMESEVKWSDFKCDDNTSKSAGKCKMESEVKWSVLKCDDKMPKSAGKGKMESEVKWSDFKCDDKTSKSGGKCTIGSEVKWCGSEVKGNEDLRWNVCIIMDLQLCSLYVGWFTVSLDAVSFCLCYLLYVLCSLCSNRSFNVFLIFSFMFGFSFCTFCFLFCVFCVFVLFCVFFPSTYIIVYFPLADNFTDRCHRGETQLQLINIISYRIVSDSDNRKITRAVPTFYLLLVMWWLMKRWS